MKKTIRFYNVIFPIWILILFPMAWIVVLPANYLVDSAVLLLSLKLIQKQGILENYKRSIVKVWLFGFFADILGAFLLFAAFLGRGDWWNEYIVTPLSLNPFDNWFSLLWAALAVCFAGGLIYLFNSKFAFRKTDLTIRQRRQIGLILAIATAPYLLLFPSEATHPDNTAYHFFTNHLVSDRLYHTDLIRDDGSRINLEEAETELSSNSCRSLVNTAKRAYTIPDGLNRQGDGFLLFYQPESQDLPNDPAPVPIKLEFWILEEPSEIYFQASGTWYRVSEQYAAPLRQLIQGT